MINKDIFDLKMLEDIPESFAKELRLINIRKETKYLLDLFDIKNKLSIDEILVGLYRSHKIVKERSWISSTLYNLTRAKLIKKVKGKKGIYRKPLESK